MAHDNQVPIIIEADRALEIFPYDGEPMALYGFLNMCDQYLHVHGTTYRTVGLLLSRLRGKAANCIAITTHNYNWVNIKNTLLRECDDGKTLAILQNEISSIRRKDSYAQFIEDVKKHLYVVRCKNSTLFREMEQLENAMRPYEETARQNIISQLPNHVQTHFHISTNSFYDFCNEVKLLETKGVIGGRPNTPKPPSNQIIPQKSFNNPYTQRQLAPQSNYVNRPQYNNGQQNFSNNNNPRHTYPPTPRSLMRQRWEQNQQRQTFNNNNRDVSMRTAQQPQNNAGQRYGPQVDLGRGFVAQELYTVDEHIDDSLVDQPNDCSDECPTMTEENFQIEASDETWNE